MDYATEGINENKVLEGTESKIESAVNKVEGILGGENTRPEESTPAIEKYKVTFYTYNNENKTEEITGEIELPNIENIIEDGKTYTVRGWTTSIEPNAEVIKVGTKVKLTEDTIYYASYETTETVTFYYNSNRTSGSVTVANTRGTATIQMNYIGEKEEGKLSVPTEVTTSVGRYNSAYVGVSSNINSMTTTNTFSNGSTYYAIYRTPVTIYYANSKTTVMDMTQYRNEYFTSASAMRTVLATTEEGTANFSFSSSVSGYSLYGFTTSANSSIRKYSSVSGLVTTNIGTAYAILYRASGSKTYYTYCMDNTTATCTEPLTTAELESIDIIGKYIDYKPQGKDYTVEGQYSGTGSNQTFAKKDNMKWRIWGVEENKLLLISEELAGNIQLKGADGYNNGVKILNDACSTAFGNSTTYGSGVIKVRSINQEDIDKVTNMTTDAQRKAVRANYGKGYTPRTYYYPEIYAQEPGKTGGGSLTRSSQSSWYTGTTNSSFTGKYTSYYGYGISKYAIQPIYDALLTNMTASSNSGTTTHSIYWVASRWVWWTSAPDAFFSLSRVVEGKIADEALYDSTNYIFDATYPVRPMVEINLDSVVIGITGLGTNAYPYSMTKK